MVMMSNGEALGTGRLSPPQDDDEDDGSTAQLQPLSKRPAVSFPSRNRTSTRRHPQQQQQQHHRSVSLPRASSLSPVLSPCPSPSLLDIFAAPLDTSDLPSFSSLPPYADEPVAGSSSSSGEHRQHQERHDDAMSSGEIGAALGSDCSDVDELLGSHVGGLSAASEVSVISVIGTEGEEVSAPPVRTKRRKLDEIPTRERWHCPNTGCGREYKRTSTTSIGQHKERCSKKPVLKARAILPLSAATALSLQAGLGGLDSALRGWVGGDARADLLAAGSHHLRVEAQALLQQAQQLQALQLQQQQALLQLDLPSPLMLASARELALQQQILLHQQQQELQQQQQQPAAQPQLSALASAQSSSSMPPLTTAQLQKLNRLLLLSDYQRAASEDSGSSSSSLPRGFSVGASSSSELISHLSRSAPAASSLRTGSAMADTLSGLQSATLSALLTRQLFASSSSSCQSSSASSQLLSDMPSRSSSAAMSPSSPASLAGTLPLAPLQSAVEQGTAASQYWLMKPVARRASLGEGKQQQQQQQQQQQHASLQQQQRQYGLGDGSYTNSP